MKKAYLVSFAPMTRVVIDVPEGMNPEEMTDGISREKFNEAVRKARAQMLENIGDYLYGDNVDVFKEDTECPYGTLKGEEM